MKLTLASAAGNVFGYLWSHQVPKTFDGSAWAQALCPRGRGFGLDGLFLLHSPDKDCWVMEHWDLDGSRTFCSNGSRAALAVEGAPEGNDLQAVSSGERIALRRGKHGVGIRMPEGEAMGLRPVPMQVWGALGGSPAAFGHIGNPQLVIQVPKVSEVDLPSYAPPLRHHNAFEGGTNVNILEPMGESEARIRSWERGVEGETLCCGTGCAVAAAWLTQRTGRSTWNLLTESGEWVHVELNLDAEGRWRDLWLAGPVRRIGEAQPDQGLFLS